MPGQLGLAHITLDVGRLTFTVRESRSARRAPRRCAALQRELSSTFESPEQQEDPGGGGFKRPAQESRPGAIDREVRQSFRPAELESDRVLSDQLKLDLLSDLFRQKIPRP